MDYTILWLVIIVVFAMIEAITLDLSAIWFAFGALFAMITSTFSDSFLVQLILFIMGSGLFLILVKPIIKGKMYKKTVKTNVDRLIGQTAIVTKITNSETGEVKILGQFWSARNIEEFDIEVNQHVEVLEISGVKLIVKKN